MVVGLQAAPVFRRYVVVTQRLADPHLPNQRGKRHGECHVFRQSILPVRQVISSTNVLKRIPMSSGKMAEKDARILGNANHLINAQGNNIFGADRTLG
jgi:hypothetical protein